MRIFLAGSTKSCCYAPIEHLLDSLRVSLDNELRDMVGRFCGSEAAASLPALSIDTATSSYDQGTLDIRIAHADLALFFLTENVMPGNILRREMETAVGSFIRRGKPYPYLFLERGADTSERQPSPELARLYDKCSFLQYRATFEGTSDAELYTAVSQVVLRREVERLLFEERAMLSHIPAEVEFPQDSGLEQQLVNACAYVCGRLRYAHGLSVSLKKVKVSKESEANIGLELVAGDVNSSDATKAVVYVNKTNIVSILYRDNKAHGKPLQIVPEKYSASDYILGCYVDDVCEKIATHLRTGATQAV